MDMESQLLVSRAQSSSHTYWLKSFYFAILGLLYTPIMPPSNSYVTLVISTLEFGDSDHKEVITTLKYTAPSLFWLVCLDEEETKT